MAANALVIAGILISELPEEGGHRVLLVFRALKVVREPAPGGVTPFLRLTDISLCTTDTSDIRTCEVTMLGELPIRRPGASACVQFARRN